LKTKKAVVVELQVEKSFCAQENDYELRVTRKNYFAEIENQMFDIVVGLNKASFPDPCFKGNPGSL
jgi:hypothetical protein